jgi:hypothetical protein
MQIRRFAKGLLWLLSSDQYKRRRVRIEIAATVADALGGFVVLEGDLTWVEDRDFRRRFHELSPENRYSETRKWVIREFANAVRDLEGDVAECGSFRGASAWFIADALRDRCEVHIFDSFSGLSPPTKDDISSGKSRSFWSEGALKADLETVRRTLSDFDNIRYYPGWIPERFGEVAGRTFRLVHIDVDLYQPTLDSLEFFYQRLVDRGVVILDDYGSSLCPGAKKAVDLFVKKHSEHVIQLPTGQGVLIKSAFLRIEQHDTE